MIEFIKEIEGRIIYNLFHRWYFKNHRITLFGRHGLFTIAIKTKGLHRYKEYCFGVWPSWWQIGYKQVIFHGYLTNDQFGLGPFFLYVTRGKNLC